MARPLLRVQWLLQLPPALRCRVVLSPLERRIQPACTSRPFSHSTLFCARASRAPKSPLLTPPTTANTRPTPRAASPPPVLATSTPSRSHQRPHSQLDSRLDSLLQETGQLLIYRAPAHASFIFFSYLFGSLLLLGSAVQMTFLVDQRRMKWYVQSLTAAAAIFPAILGTVFILGPSKMIRSISLMRAKNASTMFLRLETAPLGFRRSTQPIDALVSQVHLDKAIRGTALPAYHNVDISSAPQFFSVNAEAASQSEPNPGIVERLRALPRTLLGIRPNLVWNVRRLFVRDGMVYVRIANRGDWKLDLHDAELLDHGKPLLATVPVSTLDRSLVNWLKSLLGR